MSAVLLAAVASLAAAAEPAPPPHVYLWTSFSARRRVADLALLGDDDFRVRQAAHARLARSCDPGLLRLVEFLARRHPDPEVRWRCARLRLEVDRNVGGLRTALDALDRVPLSRYPMLDALWFDERRKVYLPSGPVSRWLRGSLEWRIRAAQSPRQKECGDDEASYAAYRLATRDLARELARAGVPLWALKMGLGEMRRRDNVFFRTHPGADVVEDEEETAAPVAAPAPAMRRAQ